MPTATKSQLVLLHGALGAQSQFEPWRAQLAAHFELHVLDFEGHGQQELPGCPFSIERFAENLEQFLKAKGLERADIFGYSMGGYVALHLAGQRPQAVGRVFTFATKLAWTPDSAAQEARRLDPERLLAKLPRFAQQLKKRHSGGDWAENLRRTADMMRALGDNPLLTDVRLATIEQRVRLGVGDRDTMVSVEETKHGYEQLPNAELLVLPGTPHPIEQIDPSRICASMVEFFTPRRE